MSSPFYCFVTKQGDFLFLLHFFGRGLALHSTASPLVPFTCLSKGAARCESEDTRGAERHHYCAKCVYVVLSLHVVCSHHILCQWSYVVRILSFSLNGFILKSWIAFRLWFFLRLLMSIYFLSPLPWELPRQQNEQTNRDISTLSSTELDNIVNVAKKKSRGMYLCGLVLTCE